MIKLLLKVLHGLIAITLLSGCASIPTRSSSVSPAAATAAAQDQNTQPGAGAIETIAFQDPTKGLASLSAYHAILTEQFESKDLNWSQRFELSADNSRQLRALSYAQTGLEGSAPFPGWEATLGDAHYLRTQEGQPCTANYPAQDDTPYNLVEPASKLPKLIALTDSGKSETVDGITAQVFDLPVSGSRTKTNGIFTGKVWIAASGGYILKAQLSLEGGEEVFGPGVSGKLTWEYQVETLDPQGSDILPADCPIPLPEVPQTADATDMLRIPGMISYTTAQSLDDVENFYLDEMEKAGFAAENSGSFGATSALLSYNKDGNRLQVRIRAGDKTQVMINSAGPVPLVTPTPKPTATLSPAAGATQSIANSLNLLLGTDTTPPVLQSYHLETYDQSPAWVNGKAGQKTIKYSADAAGNNLHFTSNSDGQIYEYYVIDGVDYQVMDGKVEQVDGAALAWALWPLNPAMVLGVGSLKAEAVGMETLEGRTADVYVLKGIQSDDTTGMLAMFGQTILKNDGKIWIDHETGALLKLVSDYQAEIKDNSGKVVGEGSGHLEVVVTKVNQVSVSLP